MIRYGMARNELATGSHQEMKKHFASHLEESASPKDNLEHHCNGRWGSNEPPIISKTKEETSTKGPPESLPLSYIYCCQAMEPQIKRTKRKERSWCSCDFQHIPTIPKRENADLGDESQCSGVGK